MCKTPDIEEPTLPSAPPPVLDQVTPKEASKSKNRKERKSGTRNYRAGNLTIGGTSATATSGLGINS